MDNYSVYIEFGVPELLVDKYDEIITHLDSLGWDHSITTNERSHIEVHATVPAQSLSVASMLALTEIQRAVGLDAIGTDVVLQEDREAREPFRIEDGEPINRLTVDEVASLIDKTPTRVRQMIAEGKFRTARQIGGQGGTWLIEMREVRGMTPSKDEEINEFDFMGHSLDRLFIQDTEDVVHLNKRVKKYRASLAGYPETEQRDRMVRVMQVWEDRLAQELARRGVPAKKPKTAYTEQMVSDEMDSLGDGARRDMFD